MNKRNYILDVALQEDDSLLITTSHFTLNVKYRENIETNPDGSGMIYMDYDVISETSYSSRNKIEKFLKKYALDAIKSHIKGRDDGL